MKIRKYALVFLVLCGFALAGYAEEKPEKYAVISIVTFQKIKTFEVLKESELSERKKALTTESKTAYEALKKDIKQWNSANPRFAYPLTKPRYLPPKIVKIKGGLPSEEKANEELEKAKKKEEYFMILRVVTHDSKMYHDIVENSELQAYTNDLNKKYVDAYKTWAKQMLEAYKLKEKYPTKEVVMPRRPDQPLIKKATGRKYKTREEADKALARFDKRKRKR